MPAKTTTRPTAPLLPTGADAIAVVSKFFRALGDPTRLRLLEFLLHDEHTVTECVAHIGLAQSRVSTHLACLAECGYVTARRDGRHTRYKVADPRVPQLVHLAHALAADNHHGLCACHRIELESRATHPGRPTGRQPR